MEKEIKIVLVSGEQIGEKRDHIRITCGDLVGWGDTLLGAIEDFDIAMMLSRKGD